MIQNELISIIGNLIQEQIVNRVKNARFYSVLGDETSDVSQTEQFCLCVRYVDKDLVELREDFISFVAVHDVTGAGLATAIKDQLRSLGLDMNNMRGQGYDGATAMKGMFRGCQAILQKVYPTALSSLKRTGILKKKLQKSSSSHTHLVKCRETQWVERHEDISIFSKSLSQIIIALEELIESGNDEKDIASSLHQRLCTFQFLMGLSVNSREQYYRRVLFIPNIEELISSLKERFATHKKTIQCLQNILTSYAADKDFISVEPAFTFYQEDLKYPSQAILRAEC
ncbi:hypothetical protein PR048_016009 [Dryococelus australis]|uniref:DUF4371 domain-containing protein n=1 Tax=Dryococelus australis TaxID=614101 RepID=A0ABQ9HIS7_9NEOP|nr:hypothetical protein PR048_016009 [Dryococelus australis]